MSNLRKLYDEAQQPRRQKNNLQQSKKFTLQNFLVL